MLRPLAHPLLVALIATTFASAQPTTAPVPPPVVGVGDEPTAIPVHDESRRTDLLWHAATAADFSAGQFQNAAVNPTSSSVELVPPSDKPGYPITGTWTSPIITLPNSGSPLASFTEAIPTFNVLTPGRTGAVLELRVRITGQSESWSPWLYMQTWGQTLTPPTRTISFPAGKTEIDILDLTKPADAFQVRVRFYSFEFDPAVRPSLRRVSVCVSGDRPAGSTLTPPSPVTGDWARELPMAFRAQGDRAVPKPLWSQICSPTSVTMVLAYHGTEVGPPTRTEPGAPDPGRGVLENAQAIFDPHYDVFGNWGRAVSRAGSLGHEAWIERFRSYDQLKSYIARGIPVVASIRFKKGEVKGFLYEATAGHLIVLRGFTPEGDVIVSDPASRDHGARQVYLAPELKKAWLDKGGVAYVILPKN